MKKYICAENASAIRAGVGPKKREFDETPAKNVGVGFASAQFEAFFLCLPGVKRSHSLILLCTGLLSTHLDADENKDSKSNQTPNNNSCNRTGRETAAGFFRWRIRARPRIRRLVVRIELVFLDLGLGHQGGKYTNRAC